jgi:hypothetical protein
MNVAAPKSKLWASFSAAKSMATARAAVLSAKLSKAGEVAMDKVKTLKDQLVDEKKPTSKQGKLPLRGGYGYLVPLLRMSPLLRILANSSHMQLLLEFLKEGAAEDDVALLLFCVSYRQLRIHLGKTKPLPNAGSLRDSLTSSVLGAAASLGLRRYEDEDSMSDDDGQQDHKELATITHQYISSKFFQEGSAGELHALLPLYMRKWKQFQHWRDDSGKQDESQSNGQGSAQGGLGDAATLIPLNALEKVHESAVKMLEQKWLPQFLDAHVSIAVRLATEPIILNAGQYGTGDEMSMPMTVLSDAVIFGGRRSTTSARSTSPTPWSAASSPSSSGGGSPHGSTGSSGRGSPADLADGGGGEPAGGNGGHIDGVYYTYHCSTVTISAEELQRYYGEHNPSKVGNVVAILKGWEGRHDKLAAALDRTYGTPPVTEKSTASATSRFAGAESKTGAGEVDRGERGEPTGGLGGREGQGGATEVGGADVAAVAAANGATRVLHVVLPVEIRTYLRHFGARSAAAVLLAWSGRRTFRLIVHPARQVDAAADLRVASAELLEELRVLLLPPWRQADTVINTMNKAVKKKTRAMRLCAEAVSRLDFEMAVEEQMYEEQCARAKQEKLRGATVRAKMIGVEPPAWAQPAGRNQWTKKPANRKPAPAPPKAVPKNGSGSGGDGGGDGGNSGGDYFALISRHAATVQRLYTGSQEGNEAGGKTGAAGSRAHSPDEAYLQSLPEDEALAWWEAWMKEQEERARADALAQQQFQSQAHTSRLRLRRLRVALETSRDERWRRCTQEQELQTEREQQIGRQSCK